MDVASERKSCHHTHVFVCIADDKNNDKENTKRLEAILRIRMKDGDRNQDRHIQYHDGSRRKDTGKHSKNCKDQVDKNEDPYQSI